MRTALGADELATAESVSAALSIDDATATTRIAVRGLARSPLPG